VEAAMWVRWVSDNPSPKLPIVAQTIVAHWWPWKYYFVSTVWIDPSEPLSRLIQAMKTGEIYKKSYEDITPGPDRFVTQIFKCDKNKLVKSMDHAFYKREYFDLTQAKLGHNETVDLFVRGRLKLKRIS
jgi:hypothetical protein